MKKLLCLLLYGILLITFAQEKQNVTVDARGVGISPDAALKDALTQAVQQAAGTLVDTKTLVKNETIMEDRILTASDGFVQSYEKYAEAKKNRQGLWTIRIKASVVMKPLKQKLKETGILVQDIGNSAQNQWAEIVSKQSSQQDVPALLESLLKKYPVESMLKAFVFDDKGRFENLKLYFPQKGRVRDGKVKVSMGVLVAVDIEKYRKQLLPELLFLLDKVALKKGRPFFVRGDVYSDIGFGFWNSSGCITGGTKIIFFPAGGCQRESIRDLWGGRDYHRLAINISGGKYRSNIQKFQVYHLTEIFDLNNLFRNYFPQSLGKIKIRLSFMDKNNDVIFYKDSSLSTISGIYREYGGSYMITPEISPCGTSSNNFSAYHVEGIECDIPLADLKEIAKVSASIVNGND